MGGESYRGGCMAERQDFARYRANLQDEIDSAALYRTLADIEAQPQLAEVYRRLAIVEERHAGFWEQRLQAAGQTVPPRRPRWRSRRLSWLAPVPWRWGNGFRCRVPGNSISVSWPLRRARSPRCLRKKKKNSP